MVRKQALAPRVSTRAIKMKRILSITILLILFSGCTPVRDGETFGGGPGEYDAVAALNRQIETFNAECTPSTMGVSPILRRVSKVRRDDKLDQIISYSEDGEVFLILKREPDGRFKGVLEAPYHELVGSGPDGSHSWGHVLAEFYLEK